MEQLFTLQISDPNIINQLWLCLSLDLDKNFILLMTYFKGFILKNFREYNELAQFLGGISISTIFELLDQITPEEESSLHITLHGLVSSYLESVPHECQKSNSHQTNFERNGSSTVCKRNHNR